MVAVGVLLAGCSGDVAATRHTPTPAVTPRREAAPRVAAPSVTSPSQLSAPSTAAETAAELTEVERGLRTHGTAPARLQVLGWEQQLAYGALSQHPEWVDTVVAAVPDDVRGAVVANHDASVELAAPDLGAPPAQLPDWTIRTPLPANVLLGYYREASAASGIPWQFLAAIHFVESRVGRIHGNSTAGAQGPMQFLPSTWAEYGAGGDIDGDHDAILAAARFLAAHGGASDIDRALYAYNPSDNYVAAIDDYAGLMAADPRAYEGYYEWQVYVTTASGTMLLPEGWHKT